MDDTIKDVIVLLVTVFVAGGIGVAVAHPVDVWVRKHGTQASNINGYRSSYPRENETEDDFGDDIKRIQKRRHEGDLYTPFGLESSVYRDDDTFTDSSGWPISEDD